MTDLSFPLVVTPGLRCPPSRKSLGSRQQCIRLSPSSSLRISCPSRSALVLRSLATASTRRHLEICSHNSILCLVPLRYSPSLRLGISLRTRTPSLQRKKKPRRLPLLITLRAGHPTHPRQERSPTRIVARLNWSLQSPALVRSTTLLIQSTRRVLTLLSLPRRTSCHSS
jgi:hypothetical protein